jgi:ABC-type amino acid transport substrate-binding protein
MADKLKMYNVKTVEDLRKLKATTSSNWVKDWTVLKAMGVPIEEASTWPSMLKMVAADRAQFTMFEFKPTPDFVTVQEGVKLAPLPGVRVTLHGERSMAVSKAIPNGKEVFNALNKGIEILRANGTIARAWRESGYIDKRTDSWVSLN